MANLNSVNVSGPPPTDWKLIKKQSKAQDLQDTQLVKKIAITSRMMDDVLTYVTCTKVRHRVYKVWAAPVIEFFMLQHTFHTSIYTSDLEKFQHKLLTSICNLPQRQVTRTEIHEALDELPIHAKLTRFAYSLTNFPVISDLVHAHRQAKEDTTVSTRQTRSHGKNTFSDKYTNQLSLPILLHELSQEHQTEKENNKIHTDTTQKFDYAKLRQWIIKTKKRIKIVNEIRAQNKNGTAHHRSAPGE